MSSPWASSQAKAIRAGVVSCLPHTRSPHGRRRPLLWTRLDHPGVKKIWADQGFAGRLVAWTAQLLGRELDIVRKDPGQRGFQVQPKQWAIERTSSWLTAHRPRPGLRDHSGPVRDRDPLGNDRHHGPPPHPRPTGDAAGPAPACTHRSRTGYVTQLSDSRSSGVPSRAGPQPGGRCEATSSTASSAVTAPPIRSRPEPRGSCSRRTRKCRSPWGKIEGRSCDQGKRVHRLNCSDPWLTSGNRDRRAGFAYAASTRAVSMRSASMSRRTCHLAATGSSGAVPSMSFFAMLGR